MTLLLFYSFQSFAQEQQVLTSVNSLGFEVNTLDELKTINWDDAIAVFEENAPTDSLKISVCVKDLRLTGKNEVLINSMGITVEGESKDILELKKKLATSTLRMVQVLEKMSK